MRFTVQCNSQMPAGREYMYCKNINRIQPVSWIFFFLPLSISLCCFHMKPERKSLRPSLLLCMHLSRSLSISCPPIHTQPSIPMCPSNESNASKWVEFCVCAHYIKYIQQHTLSTASSTCATITDAYKIPKNEQYEFRVSLFVGVKPNARIS